MLLKEILEIHPNLNFRPIRFFMSFRIDDLLPFSTFFIEQLIAPEWIDFTACFS